MEAGFIFLSGKSKNQGPELLGTVGGGFWQICVRWEKAMCKISEVYPNPRQCKLSSAADNSAPVLGTVTADNQN